MVGIGSLLTRALAFALLAAGGAAAQQRPVVVELYTSQGCSSCPPADALLARLAMREDVVALSLHVDYWDYLGWRDSHALPGNAKRQRAYAAAMGKRMVYTPQMVVQGIAAVVGADAEAVSQAIDAAPRGDAGVTLALTAEGDGLRAAASLTRPQAVVVTAFWFDPPFSPEITRGENAGDRVRYVNSVTRWSELARFDAGARDWSLEAPVPGGGVALVAQAPGPGRVLAATQLRAPAAQAARTP